MYKYASGQIRFEDFEQPVGMRMDPKNRWVRRAENIPWDEIERHYAKLFKNRKGNVTKPLRLALGACIIQSEYGYSDEKTALQIQEGPYLQFFCGFSKYEYKVTSEQKTEKGQPLTKRIKRRQRLNELRGIWALRRLRLSPLLRNWAHFSLSGFAELSPGCRQHIEICAREHGVQLIGEVKNSAEREHPKSAS